MYTNKRTIQLTQALFIGLFLVVLMACGGGGEPPPNNSADTTPPQFISGIGEEDYIKALLWGHSWTGETRKGATITYNYTESDWNYSSEDYGGNISAYDFVSALNDSFKPVVDDAISAFAEVADIDFIPVTVTDLDNSSINDVDILIRDGLPLNILNRTFGQARPWYFDDGVFKPWKKIPLPIEVEENYPTLQIPRNNVSHTDLIIHSDLSGKYYEKEIILHEIGHALGLKHSNADMGWNSNILLGTKAQLDGTIMYSQGEGAADGLYAKSSNVVGPQIYDIAALHYLYGANYKHKSESGTSHSYTGTISQAKTLWDGGGNNDVIDSTDYSGGVTLTLKEGYLDVSEIGTTYLWNAFGANIENAKSGAGNDTLIGNKLANKLEAGSDNDHINGWEGNDHLYGGPGDDDLLGGADNDLFHFEYEAIANDEIFDFTIGEDKLDFIGKHYIYELSLEISPFELGASTRIVFGPTLAEANHTIDLIGTAFVDFEAAFNADPYSVTTLLGGTGTQGKVVDGTDAVDTISALFIDLDGDFVTANNDIIVSNNGNDYLYGLAGNDIYRFNYDPADVVSVSKGDGTDVITEESGTDFIVINGVANDDIYIARGWYSGFGATDENSVQNLIIKYGTTGDKVIVSTHFYDNAKQVESVNGIDLTGGLPIRGFVGLAETFRGTNFDDTITGGDLNDDLVGSNGNDTYMFSEGDGQDIINEIDASYGGSGIDNIVLNGINGDEIHINRGWDTGYTIHEETKASNLIIHYGSGDDRIVVTNQFGTDSNYQIESVNNIDLTGGLPITGRPGIAEKLRGSNYGDTVTGGDLSDNLAAFGGDDTYVFSEGDGQDIITDYDSSDGGVDNIVLSGINSDAIHINRGWDTGYTIHEETKASNLIIHYGGGSDRIVITNQFDTDNNYQLESVNGIDLTGGLPITGRSGESENLRGTNFDDTVTGGDLNDDLAAFGGDDTYMFATGDGLDTITDYDSIDGGFDNISLSSASEIYITRGWDFGYTIHEETKASNLIIHYGDNNADRIIITNHFSGDSNYQVERINGIDLTVGLHVKALPSGSIVRGSDFDDTIDGSDSNDSLYGGDGNDILKGYAGNDSLYGENGSDTYYFAKGYGHDIVYDTVGSNSIIVVGDATWTQVNTNDLRITFEEMDADGNTVITDSLYVGGYYSTGAW